VLVRLLSQQRPHLTQSSHHLSIAITLAD
jgi:hypothetical protein